MTITQQRPLVADQAGGAIAASNNMIARLPSIAERPIDIALPRLKGVKQTGPSLTAFCPAHDDKHRSLSIREAHDGTLLFKCFAGCEYRDIMRALGLPESAGFPDHRPFPRSNGDARRIVATYDYTDELGRLLYQGVRYEPKDFRQRRPDGNDGWLWNLDGVKRVPYRLPQLVASVEENVPILWVEGERDVLTAERFGFLATTSAGGASGFTPEVVMNAAEHLYGRPVCVLPDNDAAGRKYAAQVATALREIGCRVTLLNLPGLAKKGDLSDWVAKYGNA